MKFSVENFKSIQSVKNFELSPLNFLAGTNSSGKSSLTQSLLLLKQTIESESKEALRLSGPYVVADSLTDLLYQKQKANLLSYNIEFTPDDIRDTSIFRKYIYNEEIKNITLRLSFSSNGSIHVSEAELAIAGGSQRQSVTIKRNLSGNTSYYQVTATDAMLLGLSDKTGKRTSLLSCSIEFSNFIPTFGECHQKNSKVTYFTFPPFKELKGRLQYFFQSIYYIGPIRIKPELIAHYDTTPQTRFVEPDGGNTRYILYENRNQELPSGETLHDAVTRWICQRLGLGKTIETTKDISRNYRTHLKNNLGLDIDLCHMGFGVSQVLPIIVQGLMLQENGILIVEDPCVHMHPYVQAELVDFFIEVASSGNRKVIIETHSDHIVTRIRRRLSEGLSAEKINLSFVSQNNNGSIYEKISLSPTGAIQGKLPPNFLNIQDEDFRAILKSRSHHE